MYEKNSQNVPLASFLINKIGRYYQKTRKIHLNCFSNSVIKDQKQLKLYVDIMETLAMDNDRVENPNHHTKLLKKKQKDLLKSKVDLKKQISKVDLKLNSDNQEQEQVIIGALGLAGEEGLKKLQQVTKILVTHCDENQTTKDVHKVLYLILKYLQFRIKTKEGFRQSISKRKEMEQNQRVDADNQVQQKDDILRLLTDACSLFWDDLKNLPVTAIDTGQKKKKKKQMSLGNELKKLKQDRERQQNMEKKEQIFRAKLKSRLVSIEGSLFESSSQLSKSNPYHYLISLLETQQLQKLASSLEFQIRSLNFEFDKWKQTLGEVMNEARDYLVSRLESVIQLIFRRVYGKKFIHQWAGTENTKPLLITSFVKRQQKMRRPSLNWPELEESAMPKEMYEKYNKLIIALKYITSILLGNQKIIALYSDSNIYLYLALYILYIDRPAVNGKKNQERAKNSQEELSMEEELGQPSKMRKMNKSSNKQLIRQGKKQRTEQRSVIDLQRLKDIAQEFLEKYFKASLRGSRPQDQINLSHKLILQLFSLPLETTNPYKHFPQTSRRVLAYHYFFQNLISYFVGYQFYAYLIITIVYSMGLVNKQLYSLDAEYENNIMGELLMNTVSEVKGLIEPKKPNELQNIREVEELSVWNDHEESNEMMVANDRLQINLEKPQLDGEGDDIAMRNQAEELLQNKTQQVTTRSRLLMVPLLTLKLLLCTISYYKHVIVKQKIIRQSYFRAQLQMNVDKKISEQSLYSLMAYGQLPLHQTIENLMGSSFIHENIASYELVDWLKGLAKYACRFGVEEYILEYIKHLIIINMENDEGKPHSFDKYTLELMVLEIKICVKSYLKYYKKKPDSFNNLLEGLQHQIYTLSLFKENNLNSWTLISPFTYSLLGKVRELTGIDSELRKLSSQLAQQFFSFFKIFFRLQSLTKRGKWFKELEKDDIENEGKLMKKQKQNYVETKQKFVQRDQNLRKIELMQLRLHLLAQVFGFDSLEGCGQILRVTWEVIQDYHELDKQMSKKILYVKEIQQQLSKMGNRAVAVVDNLRNYITAMQQSDYRTQEFIKFKQMLF